MCVTLLLASVAQTEELAVDACIASAKKGECKALLQICPFTFDISRHKGHGWYLIKLKLTISEELAELTTDQVFGVTKSLRNHLQKELGHEQTGY